MTPSSPIRFRVADNAGTPHDYVAGYLPADEGIEIALRLIAVGAEPLAATLDGRTSLADALDARVDLAAVAGKVRASLLALPKGEGVALIRALLAHASRDGVPLAGPGFDAAFRGNVFEALTASFEIVKANRLFPQFAT